MRAIGVDVVVAGAGVGVGGCRWGDVHRELSYLHHRLCHLQRRDHRRSCCGCKGLGLVRFVLVLVGAFYTPPFLRALVRRLRSRGRPCYVSRLADTIGSSLLTVFRLRLPSLRCVISFGFVFCTPYFGRWTVRLCLSWGFATRCFFAVGLRGTYSGCRGVDAIACPNPNVIALD